ncbi:hypothetical protein PybrP1_001646 [[Pythium] brassicae (nom. inval.)]|nr:hypothetical protein PybrP1_001646 [[Pythium] brassicae (nom. inval.)]
MWVKLDRGPRLKAKGRGGVTTYVNAKAEVRVTLGLRVAYHTTIWVENIGDGPGPGRRDSGQAGRSKNKHGRS